MTSAKLKVAACYIASPDYHNALLVLSEIAALTSEQENLNLFDDVQRDVEILRVLLLLIIEPSTHNTDPSLLSVLEKYRVLDEGFDHFNVLKISVYMVRSSFLFYLLRALSFIIIV